MTSRQPVVDAHLHVWDLSVSDYSWLTPEHGPLHSTFAPSTAKAQLDAAGVSGAVLVQAEDSLRDTEYLLAVADEHDWVAGVVGWIPLDDPTAAERELSRWCEHPVFRGVRHLVHDDPREDFLALSAVRQSLGLVAERGLTFDVPDAWPRHLDATVDLARSMPQLEIVLDHLGKPPRDREDQARWAASLRALADCPNTVAKVSGLQAPGAPFTAEALRSIWDTGWEFFGADRLMFGSDWPMTTVHGGYPRSLAVATTLADALSDAERAALFAGTAQRVYGLTSAPARTNSSPDLLTGSSSRPYTSEIDF
jgi:L-fuconolactonase